MQFFRNKKAQAILELVLAFAVLILFLVGTVKIMCWFGNSMGARAQFYSTTRSAVTGVPLLGDVFGYEQPALSLFND